MGPPRYGYGHILRAMRGICLAWMPSGGNCSPPSGTTIFPAAGSIARGISGHYAGIRRKTVTTKKPPIHSEADLELNRATSYSPTHSRMQYHRG